VGPKPSLDGAGRARPWLELRVPLLLGGHAPESAVTADDLRPIARTLGTWLIEDLVAELAAQGRRAAAILEADRDWEEDPRVTLGLGADAVNPYLLLEHAHATGDPDALPNLVEALRKGIEKVCSTLGMHEVRGYGRAFSAVGLAPDVAAFLGVRTFGASAAAG